MDSACGECGTRNVPGSEFCSGCGTYLRWQDDEAAAPATPNSAPAQSSRVPDEALEPFLARLADADVTVPADGAPARLSVNVTNTSTIVDGYVVEAVDAPAWLSVPPSRLELLPNAQSTMEVELRVVSPTLVPEQTLPLRLQVRNTTGRSVSHELPVMVAVPVLDEPVTLRAEPSLVRARDRASGTCTVVVDNSHSNAWAQVRMSASDPEKVVRASWSQPVVQVPPGGEARTEARLEAPSPEPGGEVSRTITVAARDRRRTVTTIVAFVQSTSPAPIELLALRLEPAVLRLRGARQGRLTATVDNRRGAEPVHLSLHGEDPEGQLDFAFHPATVHVQPGDLAPVQVTVTAPRTPPGQELTRSTTIVASDGRVDVRADGSVIQLSPTHRGLARVVLTVLGGLAIAWGTALRLFADRDLRAIDLTLARIARELAHRRWVPPLDTKRVPGDLEQVISVGLGLIVLAGLVIFGLTGRSGRLTRIAALVSATGVLTAIVGWSALGNGTGVGLGSVVMLAGCVAGYVGGFLARR